MRRGSGLLVAFWLIVSIIRYPLAMFLLLTLFILLQPVPNRECVVLLHGLGRTEFSMSRIENELKRDGYLVVNHSYPSTSKGISELSSAVGTSIDRCRAMSSTRIHFVTHSLGGILVRAYFQTNTAPDAHRVVMLGPPNHGSEVVDMHSDEWWFKLFTGPAGQQLGTTGDESIPIQLNPIPLDIGIIAGTASVDPLFYFLFDKPNDGKVSVESAMLPEMKDFMTVSNDHTFMMYSSDVIRQVKAFLRNGEFDRNRFTE